jgi:hypothetical protein
VHTHETGTESINRLESDLRTFSPAGIERVAWGWRQHDADTTRLHEAEKAALHQIEQADLGEEWEALRLTLRDLMEGSNALLSWKEEHGHEGHTAERAVYAAALALLRGATAASTVRHPCATARRGAAVAATQTPRPRPASDSTRQRPDG